MNVNWKKVNNFMKKRHITFLQLCRAALFVQDELEAQNGNDVPTIDFETKEVISDERLSHSIMSYIGYTEEMERKQA